MSRRQLKKRCLLEMLQLRLGSAGLIACINHCIRMKGAFHSDSECLFWQSKMRRAVCPPRCWRQRDWPTGQAIPKLCLAMGHKLTRLDLYTPRVVLLKYKSISKIYSCPFTNSDQVSQHRGRFAGKQEECNAKKRVRMTPYECRLHLLHAKE